MLPLLPLLSTAAYAGMPDISLTDLAELRLEALSFFLLALLLLTLVLQQLWNRATALPRLSYPRALGLVLLWSLLFHLVLTMISGARELMTPQAWEKRGPMYKLQRSADLEGQVLAARRAHLEALRSELWRYAESNRGRFPDSAYDSAIPAARWLALDPAGMRFTYLPGARADSDGRPLVVEPAVYGPRRLVLFTDGHIAEESVAELLQ